jgi:ribosome modulation factor
VRGAPAVRPLRIPTLVIAAALLGGCSSQMSRDECRTVDWRTVGYEDGVAGRPGDRIGEHRRACAEHGVAPDLNAYLAGRTEGLKEYCQPHNGYRAGASGRTYHDVCPADLAEAFEQAYDEGRGLYVREQRVRDADEQIESRRREIRRLEDRVAASALEVVDSKATPEQRTQAVLDTKQAAERIGRLKAEIVDLEKERARYQAELEAYRKTAPVR